MRIPHLLLLTPNNQGIAILIPGIQIMIDRRIIPMKKKHVLFGVFGLILLLFSDQITKYLATQYLKDSEGIPLLKDIFELQYLENHGAAFGIMQGQRFLLLLITALILLVLAYLFIRLQSDKRFLWLEILDVFLCAGAIGNMMDRFLHGYVIDFFYFKLINFPIFNVADVYVTVSVAIVFLLVCFYYKEEDFSLLFKRKEKD